MDAKKLAITVGISSVLLISNAAGIYAVEGTFEMRSTTDKTYRCWASALQMQDYNYKINISCRDLIYPADTNIYNYIVWGITNEGGSPAKLGALGFGKAEFKTKTEFSTLFVTNEYNSNALKPSGNPIMAGQIKPLTFLDKPTTPTPTPEGENNTNVQDQLKEATSSKNFVAGQKISDAFKKAGVVSVLALVAIIGLVFVITRGR